MPKLTEEFRERMEDVLDQYEQPASAAEPVICLDEKPYQLLDHTRTPVAARPGQPAKEDYEYRRCGTCSVFVAVEPKAGIRFVQVRRQRTRADFARFVRDLLNRYPRARKVHLVLDNLNTHNPQSLWETFPAATAGRLLKRIEWHHTPKHASWLNMAEIEISVLTKQCLDRRLSALEDVQHHATARNKARNHQRATIAWTFNRDDARRVFPELYRHKHAG